MIEIYKNSEVSQQNIGAVAQEIFAKLRYKVVLLNGEMGAGKTTFMVSLCKEIGVADEVSSPTFSIVNEYVLPEGGKLYHFDCYRLKDEYEAIDIGFEDYIYSGHLCFIEWPSKVANLLPDECVEIEIMVKDDYLREIVVREHGTRAV